MEVYVYVNFTNFRDFSKTEYSIDTYDEKTM